jgi:C4-type Zn-finger protein
MIKTYCTCRQAKKPDMKYDHPDYTGLVEVETKNGCCVHCGYHAISLHEKLSPISYKMKMNSKDEYKHDYRTETYHIADELDFDLDNSVGG